MKISRFILCALLLVGLTGCGDTVTKLHSGSAVPDNYFNEIAILQGTVFDAVTGNRITDTSLEVTLVRGTTYQEASVRTGTQSFAGDYSLSGIPLAYNNSVTYRVSASASDYQMFEGIFSPDADGGDTLDKNYNFLRNIYLFPLGVTASALKVNVTFNAEAVGGATVLLQTEAGNNAEVTDTSNQLFPQNGFLGSLSGTTDADGMVTFSGASLVLGGRYRVQVLPLTHEGIQLSRGVGNEVIIGTDDIVENVVMNEAVPGAAADEGLYILSASNADQNQVTSTGVVTFVFSRAVSLVNESVITAALTNETTAELDATTAPDTTVEAIMTTAVDGLTSTLTLIPNFSTDAIAFDGNNAGTADNGLIVTYSSLEVRIQESDDTAIIFDVFALTSGTGIGPDATVQVTPDF